MFLNSKTDNEELAEEMLNRKHEMFLNVQLIQWQMKEIDLTVNMKCF